MNTQISWNLVAISIAFVFFFSACNPDGSDGNSTQSTASESNSKVTEKPILFKNLSSEKTGIDFNNKIDVYKVKTILEYINSYNGGGVAIGDINNDGLSDIYFTGNSMSNKLYLNKGNMEFEDITKSAGVSAKGRWGTGVTMADVNGDGFLDIYVCLSYIDDASKRENLLYINNGDQTFTESAKSYGINDNRYSIEAVFFDYDKDNDLDLYVGNHGLNRLGDNDRFYNKWKNPSVEFSDGLFRNNGDGTFTDVSVEAGVLNYGFTLSLSVSDYNNDGWLDLYTAVDHTEPDILYQNNGDGTFTNVINETFKHIPFSSMGTDAADINNDGLVDLYCVDMLSDNNYRNKAQMGDMNPELFWENVDRGYHFAYMRNQLQLNMGDGSFSEIGQLSGLDKTDWSWSPLFADFNNNGYKDLFITNGYLLDIMDKDSNKRLTKDVEKARKQRKNPQEVFLDFTLSLTSTKLTNYCYRNNGDLTFSNVSSESGLNFNGFSNGAAYGDLDNDGDLDIVVNNINDRAFVYQNEAERIGFHYLKVKLDGGGVVTTIGTKVTLETKNGIQVQEFVPVRGYQSSVDQVLNFGLGNDTKVDRIVVDWINGKQTIITNPKVDQLLNIKASAADAAVSKNSSSIAVFEKGNADFINYMHKENEFDDYEIQVLLPHKMSTFGPHISKGDVNGDGVSDVFIGGAVGQSGQILLGSSAGPFTTLPNPAFAADTKSEDYGSVFVDIDNDNDLDLYVVSGGNEYTTQSKFYQDRIYLNDGNGTFTKGKLPEFFTSGSVVRATDYDNDGDQDLFVGGRHVPGQYPRPATSYILNNNGGTFSILDKGAEVFNELGMATDALWYDIDKDGLKDLIVVGEWMPVTIMKQSSDGFSNQTAQYGLEDSNGWWNTIKSGDFNGDGEAEFILGNLGLNYKYKASKEKPFLIYGNDFDQNGKYDIVLSYINDEGTFPLRGRQCSSEQIPSIADDFENYDAFAKASLKDVYGEKLDSSLHYRISDFRSSMLTRNGSGKYELTPLSNEAQMSPVYGIAVEDFDKDGKLDFILGGNLYTAEVETGRADAGKGYFYKGDGKGNFQAIKASDCGFTADGDVRNIEVLDGLVLVGNNNSAVQAFKF
jgi:hypothetical protein